MTPFERLLLETNHPSTRPEPKHVRPKRVASLSRKPKPKAPRRQILKGY